MSAGSSKNRKSVVPKLTWPEQTPRRELLARVAVRAPHRVASSPEAAADVDSLLVYGIENTLVLASVLDLDQIERMEQERPRALPT